MMASEEQPTDEVTKMDTAVVEPKQEKETKLEMQPETAREEEPDVKMEVEETQLEESSKVKAEVTMDTESSSSSPPPLRNKEEIPNVADISLKGDEAEPKHIGDSETKAQEEVAEDKASDVSKQETVTDDEEKKDDVTSTSPDDRVHDEPAKVAREVAEDWDVPGTDDEKDETGDKKTSGVWMPDVHVIIDLYQKLDREGVLELQWKCPGRRPPPEEVDEKKEESQKMEKEREKPEVEEEKQEEEPTEFDFDVDAPSVTSMAPRRTPGSGHTLGSGKKRVARMDKIFNDMLRHKRIDEELARVGDESDEAVGRTDTTPQRPVGKFRIRKDF